ncbi:hypothetical protein QBC34DRAFT_185339 [Podospora aff. communis PSN243]|uniref:NB-ARC domain-containing protein n=1 Tax=Podospora aff. communis PSN243 TaxID=3040156 RepID=A0AAV9G7J7_9PEZI|nr:hypothetical protein QBC34DRAFT_185339 [Podospora aff. communis PSN243]
MSDQSKTPHPSRQAWRVRGVPPDLDKDGLANALQRHPELRHTDISTGAVDSGHDSVLVRTLAPDLRRSSQVATVHFGNLPTRLQAPSRNELTIDLDMPSDNTHTGHKQKLETTRVTIDQHFIGITVLYSPSLDNHQIDILAVPGLGSHAFGSFVHKGDGHMWLSDRLPKDIPAARVMIYGYESGLQGSTSFANLNDLASTLQFAICRLLRSGRERPLVLIGHSLGGLLIKEVLIRMTESGTDSSLVSFVSACLFVGVPNDGMDIESLIPIVGEQPNRPLLESLAAMNSQILTLQGKNFSRILGQARFEIFCFYETELSPTAAKDPDSGQYKMIGPLRCLVTRESATSCLPSPSHAVAIARTHSDLVKFGSHDSDYDGIAHLLGEIQQKCGDLSSKSPQVMGNGIANRDGRESSHMIRNGRDGGHEHERSTSIFLVPYTSNPEFVGRSDILGQLRSRLSHEQSVTDGTSQQRVAIHGLGGIGKTQIALAYIYWLRRTHPQVSIFWVHASNAERFREACAFIAQECRVPGYDDPKVDVLSLVKTWLRSKDRGRWLMVIDNADDVQLFSRPGNLGQWIPECPHGAVLVTTRNKAAGLRLTRGGLLIGVGKMDEGESTQLLREKLKAGDLDTADLSRLASRLEHLPLALAQAAAFIEETTISVEKYLELLENSDHELVKLLSQDFETVGRDVEAAHAVAETWMLSFEQIRRQDSFAGELLSLMSLFDRQAIPREFLSDYGERQAQESGGEMQLVMALGVLQAFSFITEDKGHGFDLHRLVQLVTRKWLEREGAMDQFAEQALLVVSQNYPFGEHETRAICSAYLPHAYAVLKLEGSGSRDERLARASLLNRAAGFFNYRGDWKETERFLVQATGVQKELLGEEHPSTLTSMANLASTYWNQGRWKDAEELQAKELSICSRVLGEEHPDTLTSMANLASTYRSQGQWKEAEELGARVMETRKRVLGEEHPSTLTSMANLASTYRNQGRWKDAEELEVRVMETRKRVLGEEHPDTLTSMANLAFTWESQGRLDEALVLMRRCIEVQQHALGPDHPSTVSNVAALRGWEAASGRSDGEPVGTSE